MIHENSIVTVTPDQVACSLPGELLILQTASGVYYGLDEVGMRVWDLMTNGSDASMGMNAAITPQDPQRVADIRDALIAEYDVDRETCTRDLIGLLEKLAAKQLIEVRSAPAA